MTLYVVKIKEVDRYSPHVYLIEAKNENQAKNLGEAKWYESSHREGKVDAISSR